MVMRDVAQLRALLPNANLVAFFATVRQKESRQDVGAFNLIVYGDTFADFADHPRRHYDRVTHRHIEHWRAAPPYSTTSAAGALQITETTWDEFCTWVVSKLPFTPENQLLCGAWLIQRAGTPRDSALDDVLAGRFDAAATKCRGTWTSLPGASESRPDWTMDKARNFYQQWGGSLHPVGLPTAAPAQPQAIPAPPPAAPVPDAPYEVVEPLPALGGHTMNPSFLLQLVQPLLAKFSPAIQQQINAPQIAGTETGDKLLNAMLGFMGKMTGQTEPVDIVSTVKAKPELVKMAEANVADQLDKLMPAIAKMGTLEAELRAANDASADAAAARGQKDKVDIAPTLVSMSGWGFGAAFVGLLGLMALQMILSKDYRVDPTLAGFLGLFVYGVIRMSDRPSAYRFGGAYEGQTVDATKQVVNETLKQQGK